MPPPLVTVFDEVGVVDLVDLDGHVGGVGARLADLVEHLLQSTAPADGSSRQTQLCALI